MRRGILVFALMLQASGCHRSKINEAEWKEAGANSVLPFKKSLKQALLKGLEDGPVEAISVCRMQAPDLAKAASAGGIRVGRTSDKLRNPGNAAKPWMEPFLELYGSDPDGREPRVVAIDDHTIGYVEPIFVEPLCITCHGADLDPQLEAKLKELYPDDRATGYLPGDLRGVFWAELPRK